MHKKNINIAVIGTGFMGRTHSYSVANLPFFYENLPFKPVLHTICSRDKEHGESIKNEWGFLYSETNFDKILSNKEIDVIDICTPNIYHCSALLKSIDAGKNIYCEKPLVISADEASQVIKKLEKTNADDNINNLICSMVFHNRFSPAVLKAKQLVKDDKIGEIISFRCAYQHNSNLDLNKNAGWKQDADIGGGVLFDLGSHAIDLVRFLCCNKKEITSIFGTSQIFFPVRKGTDGKEWRTNADEAFYMTLKLGNAIGTIEASKLTTGANSDLSIEIYGTKGALKYSLMQPNFLEYYDHTKPSGDYGGEKGFITIECMQRYPKPGGIFPGEKSPIGWLRLHMHSYYLYLDSIYNNKLSDLLPSFYDGAAVQNIMGKAYLSDKSGSWETV